MSEYASWGYALPAGWTTEVHAGSLSMSGANGLRVSLEIMELPASAGAIDLSGDPAVENLGASLYARYADHRLNRAWRRSLFHAQSVSYALKGPGEDIQIEVALAGRHLAVVTARAPTLTAIHGWGLRELLLSLRPPGGANQDAARALRRSSHTERKGEGDYDVFLCHNSKDKPQVRQLRDLFEAEGLVVWLDEEEIDPGDELVGSLERALPRMSAIVVCYGQRFTEYQEMEYQAAIRLRVKALREEKRPIRIVPVSLPGGAPPEEWNLFAQGFIGRDLRDAFPPAPEMVRELVRGILGDKGD